MSVRTLPLWIGLKDKLIADGVKAGDIFDAQYFENELSCKRDSREFGLAVHKIRMALEKKGLYLRGHVMRDKSLVILAPEKNVDIAIGTERMIRRRRERSIMLLGATDRTLLPPKIKALTEKVSMRIEIRAMIEKRAARIHRYLTKKAPKLLGAKNGNGNGGK
jgi:hypothetical protein